VRDVLLTIARLFSVGYRLLFCCLCLALASSCSYVDSTITTDSAAVADLSVASVAYRQKTTAWPADSAALDTFSKAEGLSFRSASFNEIHFAQTNDVLYVEYTVAGGMTKGKTRIALR
jgi:hypothetical protein